MKIIEARTLLTRATGLLMRPKLLDDEALWLSPCRSIHTFGMRYSIAVFFLNQSLDVLDMRPCVKPNRIVYCQEAHSVCEMLAISEAHCSRVCAELSVALLLNTAT